MEQKILQDSLLFRGLEPEEIGQLLQLLAAREKRYGKGETLLHAGEQTRSLGIVLSGSVTVESNDMWGNRTILSHVGPGQFFAETYALLPGEPLLVDVTANEDCAVMYLRADRLDSPDFQIRPFALRFLTNLLRVSVSKNLHLSARSFHTAPKTVRSRVMSYLNAMALQTGRDEFDIPFDRQQLADYLNVDRTALSKELGRMRGEGILQFRKAHFKLIARP